MARSAKPWFWKARKVWCVYVGGEKVILGPDRGDAFQRFHEIMAKPTEKVQPRAGNSIDVPLQAFLTWTKENRAKKTHDRYFDFLDAFERRHHGLSIKELNAGHVQTWLNEQTTWNSTTKRSAITALQRAFNWAVKNMGLDKNPIRGMEKPAAKTRATVVTPAEFDELLAHVTDQPFRDLLIASFDSGCRPQEIKGLEARHVQLDKQRALIPAEEAKGGIPRAIYFPTERSMEIVNRLIKLRPIGNLFLTCRGTPWNGFNVKNRFEDLQITMGIEEMNRQGIESAVTEEAIDRLAKKLSKTKKSRQGIVIEKKPGQLRQEARRKLIEAEAKEFGVRFRQYDLRHSFVTRKLLANVDSHVVASLAGHRDTTMIHKVYSHVADDHQFMLQAAKTEITAKDGEAQKKKVEGSSADSRNPGRPQGNRRNRPR